VSSLFREASGSRVRFHTVEIRATASYNNAAFERYGMRAAATRGGGASSLVIYDASNANLGRAWERFTWRVWWAPPSRWRDELTWPEGQTDVAVVRSDARMIYLAAQRTLYTSELVSRDSRWEIVPAPAGVFELPTLDNRFAVFPLIRPPLPERAWEFATVKDGETYAGRVTRRVRVTRRALSRVTEVRPDPGYLPLADEYECLIDDELRLVMRLRAIVSGEPVAEVSVDDIRLDSAIPPDTFSFVPPTDARIAHVERSS
jgi:hypothetical protein